MAQLKSFKYIETNDSESTTSGGNRRSSNDETNAGQERQEANESGPMAAEARGVIQRGGKSPRRHSADNVGSSLQSGNKTTTDGTSNMSTKQFQANDSKPFEASSSSSPSASSSIISTVLEGASTGLGAALTTDNSSQSSENSDTRSARRRGSDRLSSNEEYQSARVDLEDDDDDEDEQDYGGSYLIGDQSNKENHINQQQQQAIDEEARLNVTKIQIEHPNQRRGEQNFGEPLGPAKTPLTPRQRATNHMPRSHTSPSLAPRGVGVRSVGGTGVAIPIVSSPIINLKRPGSATGGDNMSQSSKTLNPNLTGNQFEIRWHNIKLYVRPKRRLPKFISDSFLYKALCSSQDDESNVADEMMQFETAPFFYSPPVQHKIPPTIDEGLEMKAPSSPPLLDKSVPSSPIVGRNSANNRSTAPGPASSAAPIEKGTRCVLNSVSGQVFSGQITAILGPSGVGKTSLLNSLTGRNTLDGTGRVSLICASDCKRMSVVTVPQIDVLPNKLTALEDLQFTSRLKNPGRKFDHGRNIDRIVKHLHMDKFLNTQIDKLSGGEARRLSIARELLNSPDILILDEPTSGLDANTCKKIIIALRDIVEHSDNLLDKPMSIIITIHQPQQEVYNLFHRVYVMALGGRAIYEGPPKALLPTLLECSSLGRVCPVDQLNENPAIVAIEVASGEYGLDIINELAMYHENQVYGEFLGGTSAGIGLESPMTTPQILRKPYKSPLSVAKFEMSQLRKRQESFDSSIGRPTPVLAKRQLSPVAGLGGVGGAQSLDCMSSMTSISYASSYDADLPEPVSKLKIDKRLRRSVVMKSNFWSHTGTLIERSWLLTKRDRVLMFIRILGFLLVAMGTVQIFSDTLDPTENQCPKFESEVDNIYAYMGELRTRLNGMLAILRQASSTHSFFFHVILCLMMVTSALTGLVFPTQMRMFMREYKNGWYSPASFIMSQTIAELPVDLIGPLLTLAITYPLCNQPESPYHWREICYAIVFVVSCIICKSQAQIVGAFLMDSIENSVFIACVAVTPAALFSGIPVRINQMVMPLQWVSYGSFLRYAFESLMSLRYGYDLCPCDDELINGYPITASTGAIPPHLETLARGFIALNQPDSGSLPLVNETTTIASTELATLSSAVSTQSIGDHDNLFLRFIRLLTDASNMFVGSTELSSCNSYRSLYLVSIDVKSDQFTDWIVVMLVMFVFSRILTYFAVKTVIKMRRS